jgi:hypothetical protein
VTAVGVETPAALGAPMREFLTWVAFRERTYADVVEAWGSHCPRFTEWEDAQDAGLVELACNGGVRLTARGRTALTGCS